MLKNGTFKNYLLIIIIIAAAAAKSEPARLAEQPNKPAEGNVICTPFGSVPL